MGEKRKEEHHEKKQPEREEEEEIFSIGTALNEKYNEDEKFRRGEVEEREVIGGT